MKTTSTLIIALAALSLASCAEDEPVSYNLENENEISFRPAMGSRASEVTNANLQSFWVTSFIGDTPYFNNVEFSKGAGGFFNSVKPYYWPADTTSVEFYAYSPSLAALFPDDITGDDDDGWHDFYNSEDAGLTFNATEKKLVNFMVSDSINKQVDFITAYGKGNRKENESAGVELTFDHRLTQIEIRAKSENPTYTFKVKGVRIGRVQYMGSFDFTTNAWTLDEWHDTQVCESSFPEVTLTADPVSIMGPNGNAMLLPQTLIPWNYTGDPDNAARGAYLSVFVQISTTETGAVIYPFPSDTRLDPETKQLRKYAWASIPLSTTWEAGKKYIYTLDFTNGAGYIDPDDPNPGKPVLGEAIKFTVTVNPWTDTPQPTPMPVK